MDKPIHNLFAFVSGRYQVMQEIWNGIKFEIFYHPKHSYNPTMMDGMKKSIEYYSDLYGPYPYKQCRIIEFFVIHLLLYQPILCLFLNQLV